MPAYDLQHLDNRTVAVEVAFPNRRCVLKGVGKFDSREVLGPALRVGIKDPTGDFEIVLRESQWNGRISTGEQFSCDFAVQLDASCLCAS